MVLLGFTRHGLGFRMSVTIDEGHTVPAMHQQPHQHIAESAAAAGDDDPFAAGVLAGSLMPRQSRRTNTRLAAA